jgi:hypothetical protein
LDLKNALELDESDSFSFSWENKDHGQWEYYTLECLLYFLKNVHLSHPAYVKEAAVSVFQCPDVKMLTSNNSPIL